MAISKMAGANQTANDSAALVRELGERSKQIGDIVDVITGRRFTT